MKNYPLFKVHVPQQSALSHLQQVFESGFINEGTQVTTLQNRLREVLHAKQLVLLNSCTSALTLALKLAGVGAGDEVITTPMTCVATNSPIVIAGAKIVWADVDPRHGMITHESVLAKVTPRTKAVMAVAWAGTPPNLFMLEKTCKALDLKLILDAAHAFDAHYRGVPVHEWADYTCYSFQAIKHFTTGDGGALVSRDESDFQRSKALKWFGLDRDRAKDDHGNWKGQQWDVDIEEVGYKFNMNNLAAALGLSQLEHIPHIMGSHRCNAAVYDELFSGHLAVTPNYRTPGAESSHWVYAMQVDPERSRLDRDELLKVLNAEGIHAGVVHVPNDDYACFKQYKDELPGVRQFAARQFALPCGWWLNDDDVRHIAQRVKELTK